MDQSDPDTWVNEILTHGCSYACIHNSIQRGTKHVSSQRGSEPLLTVYNHIKLQVDLQADMSPIVAKVPFFPRVVNPRYRIRGTNV
jgi:hypothetical protein